MSRDSSLSVADAILLPSALPGVSAWITPITLTPIGITCTIALELMDPSIRYHPTATFAFDLDTVEIGDSTSAEQRFSMTKFWYGVAAASLDGTAVLELFEADRPTSTNRAHVDTFTLRLR